MIDTSSALSALALVEDGRVLAEDISESGREYDMARRAGALVEPARLSGVAVALGPGSFTGLRVGVSYGVGLALGLELPLWGLESLELQAARAREPATAVVEAGRGRLYWLAPGGGEPGHGEPGQLPRGVPAVGWLRAETAAAVLAAGVRLLAESELEGFGSAAGRLLLRPAEMLGYDTVRLRYMHSLGATRGR